MFNKSILITILGFVGFTFACFVLFFNCGQTKSLFHEVQYDSKTIAKAILKGKRDSIRAALDTGISRRENLSRFLSEKDTDSVKLLAAVSKKVGTDSICLRKINSYYSLSDPDSLIFEKAELNLKASVNLDSLLHFDMLYKKGHFDTLFSNGHFDTLHSNDHADTIVYTFDTSFKKILVQFIFHDTDIQIGEIYKPVPLPVTDFYSDVDLFSKYPGFAVWAFLILVFCCCFAMTIGFCIHLGNELTELTSNKNYQQPLSYWPSFWICFGLLGIFATVVNLTFYDSDAIKDLYFMKGLGTRIGIISVFGYLAAAFCFAGMISTASYAKCFKDKIQNQRALNEEIGKLTELLKTETDIVKITKIQADLQLKRNQLIVLAPADYAELNKLFRKFFYAIALLLALLVFCTGALYSAVDSLDFVKLIKKSMGFSPARQEFIYLYAALHTLLILLFYLPAQLQLNSYKSETEEPAAADGIKKNFLTGLGSQLKKTSDILLVGAPLLASFAQWLLNIIFEN